MNRPWIEAAEQNKRPILAAIKPYLQGDVLEIGSGTGQHAVYFAGEVPGICWQTSELESNLPEIEAWIEASGLDNLPPPIALDVYGAWPQRQYDLIFTSNTFHILHQDGVEHCMQGTGFCLKPGAVFAVYGAFNYNGRYTSESNARFDRMLRQRDPGSGIRDFSWIERLAGRADLELLEDVEMPANNRTLIWQKRTL